VRESVRSAATRCRLPVGWGIALRLTNRFPPLTRRRAMTAERYGPTLPTGKYPVVDHALGSWPLVRPDGRYCYASDSRTCTPGPECITGFQSVRFAIPRRNRRRYTAGFRPPGARGRGPRFPVTIRRRPPAGRDASPEAGCRLVGCGQFWLRAVRIPAGPGRCRGKAALRILFCPAFCPAGQNCPQTDVSFPRGFGGQYWGVACNPIWDTMAKADGGWQCDAS
jgi:hypothetical protein